MFGINGINVLAILKTKFLPFSFGSLQSGYYDANFQTDRDNIYSQYGWVFLLNGRAVTWKSSKHQRVDSSTCEQGCRTRYSVPVRPTTE